MLKNSLTTSDTTRTYFLELISFQNDQKIWQKYFRGDLSSFLPSLACWLSISVLAQGFLAI